MDTKIVDLILSRIKNGKMEGTGIYKYKRYRNDEVGLFYFSNRYDKNYTHLWDTQGLASP